ncbi:MAG: DUF58 domain-containing protein, partial [Paracoccus sp. (in: a-proteobacteria)]|nr:DUF58 domain-containing protein [Paracoccus sp. (in: a-proteobacteria)]
FWQYRPAHSSESAARIDWRRSARGDAQFVRDRERQTARSAAIWVGRGAGMGWQGRAGQGESKYERARLIGLSLALSMIRGGERVALLGAASGAGAAQAGKISFAMASAQLLPGDADAPAPETARPGQIAILIDDFLQPDPRLDAFVARLADLGTGGVLLQVLHPDETTFPFTGALRFETAGGQRHETRDAEGLRRAYLARLEARREALAALARQGGMIFGSHDLDQPVSAPLIWLHGVLSAR